MSDVGKIFVLLKEYKRDRQKFPRGLAVEIVEVVFAGWVKVASAEEPGLTVMVRRSDLRPWPKGTCCVCRRSDVEWRDDSQTLCAGCAPRNVEPKEDDAMAKKSAKEAERRVRREVKAAGKSGGMAAAVAEKKPRGRKAVPATEEEVQKVRKSRTKQSTMGDMVSPQIREVEQAADMYCDLRDERIKWGVKEKEAKTHLIEMMKKHELTNYPYDGRLVQFQAAMDEEVKVKDVKSKPKAEDGMEDDEADED